MSLPEEEQHAEPADDYTAHVQAAALRVALLLRQRNLETLRLLLTRTPLDR